MNTTLRRASVEALTDTLRDLEARKLDVVLPGESLDYRDGRLILPESVRGEPLALVPTSHFRGQLCEKAGIPTTFFRELEKKHQDVADHLARELIRRSESNYFVRAYAGGADEPGIARALLSDRYRAIDHYDVLLSAGEALQKSGTKIEAVDVDLTETKLVLKVQAPEIFANAEDLVRRYEIPGRRGVDYLLVFAGLELSNSEVGSGRFSLTPRLIIQVCVNGMVRSVDALNRTHLGARLEEATVAWSAETRAANQELVLSQTRDAVGAYLTRGYVERWVEEQRGNANRLIEAPVVAVDAVVRELRLSVETKDRLLNLFSKSGDPTAFGMRQAMTRLAQEVESGDDAYDLEHASEKVPAIVAGL